MTALYVFDIDQSRKQGQISKNVSLHFSQPAPIITSLSNHFNNLAKPRPAKIDTDCSSWVKVSRPWLDEIALGRRAVTTDTAPRLARHFGTTPEFWINLQTRYDPDVAERTVRQKIDREVVPRAV